MIRAENDISEIDAHYSAKLGAITERLEELNSYIQTLMSTCDDSLVKIGLSAFLGGNSSDKISDKKKNELIKNFEAEHKEEAEKLNKLVKKLDISQIREIKYIIYSASEPYRSLYLSELDSYTIGNISGDKTGYFTTRDNTINVDMTKEETNPRGAYTTFFHESGHAIDYNYIDDGQFYSVSCRDENGNSLQELIYRDVRTDVQKTVARYTTDETMKNNLTEYIMSAGKIDSTTLTKTENMLLSNIQSYYSKDMKGALNEACSDVYGGVTGNIIHGSYGHWSTRYWYDSKGKATFAQSKELWAEYYSYQATGNNEAMEKLREHFPLAGEFLDEMAEKMAS